MVRAVGADGCRAGWIAAVLEETADGAEHLGFHLFPDVTELAGWRDEHAPGAVVALDIPMGLKRTGGPRPCDGEARAMLGALASSVFAPPGRYLLGAAGYTEIQAMVKHLQLSSPETPGLSAQSAGIIPKIAEVDAFLLGRPHAQDWLIEVHPELSFARWADATLLGKRSPAGVIARLTLVRDRFAGAEPALADLPYPSSRVGLDDALDACAALWSALRWGDEAEVLGGQRDERGLIMRIAI